MKAGLVGYPISHSLSPQIFSILSRNYDVPLQYDTIEIHPSYMESFINEFPWKNYLGFNVTIPYKEVFKNYMTRLDPMADTIGVVNVVKVEGDERIGYNTDVFGFLKCLEEENIQLSGKDCVIFGTGGAAKAAIHGLKSLGVKSITVATRHPEQLKYLGVPVENYSAEMEADLYVNATPLGTKNFHENESPYMGTFKPGAIVFDMVYQPTKTVLMKHAEMNSVRAIGGLNMLIWQALKTWEIWFDKEVHQYKPDVYKKILTGVTS